MNAIASYGNAQSSSIRSPSGQTSFQNAQNSVRSPLALSVTAGLSRRIACDPVAFVDIGQWGGAAPACAPRWRPLVRHAAEGEGKAWALGSPVAARVRQKVPI